MPARSIEVIRPGGQKRKLAIGDESSGRLLLDVLESNGFPLNTRCGGRGLCKGCQVELHGEDGQLKVRSCQRRITDLPPSTCRITIPENSWRDHSLHGVSAFEIHKDSTLATGKEGYGIALDIGTTTVAGALWEMKEGHCVADESRANTQARFGDNVLSRISYALENANGILELQTVLLKECLKPLVSSLCKTAGICHDSINTVSISGNPVMLHTVVGESLKGFSAYPFQPEFLKRRTVAGSELGIGLDCDISLLPGLGPFVGADIVAGALAAGLLQAEAPVLLVDFGTNGEILLKHNSGYLATATAAGPAFEGGRLSCGAVAREGVISSLERVDEKWEWLMSGNEKLSPKGISGAAYVDFMATGKDVGLLDLFGRINRNHPDAIERLDGEDTDWCVQLGSDLYISESDIAELLQAKAAIQGGVATLLELAGVEPQELGTVLVAGGFGYHLDPKNAVNIGLLPDVPMDRIRIVGNASLGGASLLLNPQEAPALNELMNNCEVIELNQVDSFEDHFTDSLMLEKADLD
ncbi:MAG: ASKHA domain-containing protein [Puniceicoccaceae bacterium]